MYKTEYIVLALLLTCTYSQFAQYRKCQGFGAYQVTLWHGNNSTQYANTPNGYDYYYQVPDLYTSVQQVGLNWMGAKWVNNNQMNYTAYVAYISATNQCKINVNPYGSITFYYISFSVVILSVQSSSYLQLYNETLLPIWFNQRVNATGNQYFTSTTSSAFVFANASDYLALTSITYYNVNNANKQIAVSCSALASTSHLNCSLWRWSYYPGTQIFLLNVNVLVIKWSKLKLARIAYNFQSKYADFSFHRSQFSTGYQFGDALNRNCTFGVSLLNVNKAVPEIFYNVTQPNFSEIVYNATTSYTKSSYWFVCFLECLPSPTVYYNQTTYTCGFCSDMMPNCVTCTDYKTCLSCSQTNMMAISIGNKRLCSCIGATAVIGGCTKVQGCISINSSTQLCSQCDTQFYLTLNYTCDCIVGLYLTGVCYEGGPGCSSAININGTNTCTFCTLPFVLVNKSCSCPDHYFYNITTSSCQDICGDGFVISLQCDDGNLLNGDGCSSLCQIQPEYRCSQTSNSSPSICVYVKSNFVITLVSIQHTLDQNQGIFTFKISPQLFNLNKINFTEKVNFSCSSNFTINSISYIKNLLELTINYTTNMENLPATLNVSMSDTYFIDTNLTLNFTIISNDTQLIIISDKQSAKTRRTALRYIGIISLAFFVLASNTNKMFGVQILHLFQSFYFLQLLNYQQSPIFSIFLELKYATDIYHGIFNDLMSQTKFFTFLELSKSFTSNYLIVGSIQILAAMLLLVFWLRLKFLQHKHTQTKSKVQDEQVKKLKLNLKKCYEWLFFPALIGFIYQLTLSYYTLVFKLDSDLISYRALNSLFALVPMLLIIGILSFQNLHFFNVKVKFHNFLKSSSKFCSRRYVGVYITYQFIWINSLIYSYFSFNKLMVSILTIEMIFYLFILLLMRPYQNNFHNFSIISNQLFLSLYICLILYQQITNILLSEDAQNLIILIVVAVLVFALIITAVRVIIEFKRKIDLEKKRKEQENLQNNNQKLKQVKQDNQIKDQVLKSQEHQKIQVQVNFSQKPNTKSLTKLKQKLRQQLKEKRKELELNLDENGINRPHEKLIS